MNHYALPDAIALLLVLVLGSHYAWQTIHTGGRQICTFIWLNRKRNGIELFDEFGRMLAEHH